MLKYLTDYLNGEFDTSSKNTLAFKRACKSRYKNTPAPLFRALRLSYGQNISIPSSHPNLISCSDNMYCAIAAAYSYDETLRNRGEVCEEYHKIIVVEFPGITPLLTHSQIKSLMSRDAASPVNLSSLIRLEREFLCSYTTKLAYTVVKEVSTEEAKMIFNVVRNVCKSISEDI